MLKLVIASSAIILASCTSFGPQEIKADMPAFSDVLMHSSTEQILRNIVYLSYGQPVSYLKITSIATSYSLTTSAGANAGWSEGDTAGGFPNTSLVQSLGISPSISYSNSPTISYMPVDDAAFVNMIDQPLTFQQIALLYNGEVSNLRLLWRLIFSQIGDLENSPGAVNSDGEENDDFGEYITLTIALNKTIKKKTSTFSLINYKDQTGLMLHFKPNFTNSDDVIVIKKLLMIPPKYNDIFFINTTAKNVTLSQDGLTFIADEFLYNNNNNLTFVKLRSISSIMRYLSHSVRVPDKDLKKGYSVNFKDSEGQPHRWSKSLDDLMTIYSSDSEPSDAFVKTFVNNHWFYINMSDTNSKYTFSMLMKLMTIALGYAQPLNAQNTPILTLPIGPPNH